MFLHKALVNEIMSLNKLIELKSYSVTSISAIKNVKYKKS